MKLSPKRKRLCISAVVLFMIGVAAVWWMEKNQPTRYAKVEYWSGFYNPIYSRAENEELRNLEEDLREIVIPSIDFDEIPFSEAMNFLADEFVANAPDRAPVYFEMDPALSQSRLIKLRLTSVPMAEALRYTISLNKGSFRTLPGRRISVESLEAVSLRGSETHEGNFFVPRTAYPTFTGPGPHDLKPELESAGVSFRENDEALFYPDRDLVWASLTRDQMDLVNAYFSSICYIPEPTRFEKLRDGIYHLVGYDPYASAVTSPALAPNSPVDPFADPFGGDGIPRPSSEPDPFGGGETLTPAEPDPFGGGTRNTEPQPDPFRSQ